MYLYQKSMIELYLSIYICGIFRKTISLHQLIEKNCCNSSKKKYYLYIKSHFWGV